MSKVLTSPVTLRKSEKFGDIHYFAAGETLPEWAEGLVGDHLFEDKGHIEDTLVRTEGGQGKLPNGDQAPVQAPGKLEVPKRSGSKADWLEFATALKVKGVSEDMSRDELVELVETAHPELFSTED